MVSVCSHIGNINYTVENPEKYREEARDQAIANAKTQAQKLANQLGIHLGKVSNIVESSTNPGPIPFAQSDMKTLAIGSNAPVQPAIQPGTQTIDSTVTLYFEKN